MIILNFAAADFSDTKSSSPRASLNRAPRSTQEQQAEAELRQTAVIAHLTANGHDELAQRITRCQHDRQNRGSDWPWRCRSAGCYACRRTITLKWWQTFLEWSATSDRSLATIPATDDLFSFATKFRKGLRDVRDRTAKEDERWQSVACAGLIDGGRALILVKHPGISRSDVWATLEGRWPEMTMRDVGDVFPKASMTVEDAAEIARRGRGIEPLRIVMLPMGGARDRVASEDGWGEPMPICW